MSLALTNLLRQARTGLLLLLVATAGLGLVYPLAVFAVGRLVPARADGQVVAVDGQPVGSRLIGQEFPGEQWFQPRPSAAGDGYDPTASGASNLGPESTDLLKAVEERRAAVAAADGTAPVDVAPDALTASGSGLDPHVSPENARRQVARVAAARGLSEQRVAALVAEHTRGRALGFLGEPTVNVLELNLALRSAAP
ncbi:potassium-transporting ATPase subunit KdpC [Kineococcus radiotolerans]|uniref:Potassium-transporting ATPase KdpC subunit n=1 Tax=Kineococcus radiotolerans (strain ATCC BAA-149 / DSM 14245 / SRS30216) TaxID=266940 RepID=KDPC_KINRD|nr:potassium-transporting ATPase subunit KdpC [Kineococcus radiotolerans]A6W6R7.1 RecName: Full=Potassium-transporting ATPase KdpC subunit; AltName: Full=ATP phosphohydrolase [potassium-transporting] C chain; AltName: Full=Potassium-binding and translocating subunit C; AltName: Full=Potassium-translocating ATPase C chain [Kineococcus radiotolerans SRS30216 = ATCC BAA-149]ABS02506.1 potassium-transporting ATPase, C subunit [Kineococcus radiotolerans SRS30216 = ATCC BAA-149]